MLVGLSGYRDKPRHEQSPGEIAQMHTRGQQGFLTCVAISSHLDKAFAATPQEVEHLLS